jgi:hypothetical protein
LCGKGYSQVGVNTEHPNKLTYLDINNLVNGNDTIPGGIMIPRMSETLRNTIDVSDADLANSLMIYNTTEDCYNFYSKSELAWISLCNASSKEGVESGAVENAAFEYLRAESHGQYNEGETLNRSNYLTAIVNVRKPGAYHITATTKEKNGYYFTKEGQFLNTGRTSIELPGYGTPIHATSLNGEGDQIFFQGDGNDFEANLKIPVTNPRIIPNYTIQCLSPVIEGAYIAGKDLDETNVIKLKIIAEQSAAGSNWEIKSDEVNGYSFSGEGRLNAGEQIIELKATGKPLTNGENVFHLQSNSQVTGGTSYEIKVKVATRRMSILCWSKKGVAYDVGDSENFTHNVISNSDLFAPNQQAVFPVNGIELYPCNKLDELGKAIEEYNPDIILAHGYMGACGAFSERADLIEILTDYVNAGGVLIYCSDGNSEAKAPKNKAAQSLSRSIFNNKTMTATGNDDANIQHDLIIQDTGTLISNGPSMYLAGKPMGHYASRNFNFNVEGFPYQDATVIAFGNSAGSVIRAFMHKSKGFVFIGDAAAFQSNQEKTKTDSHDYVARFATIDGAITPIPNIYNSDTPISYGSFFILNTLAWAFDYVQKHNP